jgi:hypothetical protein
MQEYRLQNQALFERNFVPHMLGWYRLTATTSLPEMEWMLARAAGHNAGFAMSTTLKELQANADTGILLDGIREWEAARRSGAFSAEQRERLKDPARAFHLEPVTDHVWDLSPFHAVGPLRHEQVVRQPGEPMATEWTVVNADEAQPLQFRLQVLGEAGAISRPVFEIDGAARLELPIDLKAGESLVCDGTVQVRVYDAKGRQTATLTLTAPPPRLAPGSHRITFGTARADGEGPRVEATFTTRGAAERVRAAIR